MDLIITCPKCGASIDVSKQMTRLVDQRIEEERSRLAGEERRKIADQVKEEIQKAAAVMKSTGPKKTPKYTHACQYYTVPAIEKSKRPITAAREKSPSHAFAFKLFIIICPNLILQQTKGLAQMRRAAPYWNNTAQMETIPYSFE